MKAKFKLLVYAALASAAIVLASQSEDLQGLIKKGVDAGPCYTDAEVQLLMKAHDWSKQEAETILKLACQFSDKHKPLTR